MELEDLEIRGRAETIQTTALMRLARIVRALGKIKKGTDKHIYKITDNPSLCETQKKMHITEQLISLKEYYQYDWKISLVWFVGFYGISTFVG